MLKIKGEIVDILKLLLDEDESIKNLVGLFLQELNLKDGNRLYNLFQNAIIRLSGKEFETLTRADHESIIGEVFRCFNDERKKQLETLIDTLGKTLKNSRNLTEQMNCVFALSLMPFNKNEGSIAKLIDNAGAIRDCLN